MTDVAKARESAIAAETRIETTMNRALDRLHALNNRLVELHALIKEAQPVASGAICLELYPCGPGCSGCPHPRWVKYMWTEATDNRPAMLLGLNLDSKGKDPVRALLRKGTHYPATVKLIREAKTILAERANILSCVRPLRYAAKS